MAAAGSPRRVHIDTDHRLVRASPSLHREQQRHAVSCAAALLLSSSRRTWPPLPHTASAGGPVPPTDSPAPSLSTPADPSERDASCVHHQPVHHEAEDKRAPAVSPAARIRCIRRPRALRLPRPGRQPPGSLRRAPRRQREPDPARRSGRQVGQERDAYAAGLLAGAGRSSSRLRAVLMSRSADGRPRGEIRNPLHRPPARALLLSAKKMTPTTPATCGNRSRSSPSRNAVPAAGRTAASGDRQRPGLRRCRSRSVVRPGDRHVDGVLLVADPVQRRRELL